MGKDWPESRWQVGVVAVVVGADVLFLFLIFS